MPSAPAGGLQGAPPPHLLRVDDHPSGACRHPVRGQCTACARRPAGPWWRGAAHRQERDLARHPVHAAVQPAAEHQAHADTGADVHEREAVGLLADTERPLGQRRRVHVVLDRERGAERRAQPDHGLRLVPAGQAAGQRHQVPLRVVDAGAADDRRGYPVAGDPGARAQLVGELDELGHPVADRRRAHRHGQPGTHLARQVGDRSAQVAQADVEAEHEPGLRPDLVQQGGAAGQPRPLARQPDQAGPLKVRQRERDGRLGQPGHARELRPRVGTRGANVVKQQLLVERPDQRRTCGGKAARRRRIGRGLCQSAHPLHAYHGFATRARQPSIVRILS